MSAHGGTKAIVAALAANLGIAVAKFGGFVVTGSSSLLAESIHSLADSGNQGLLLLGAKRAERPADALHSFGYGRERYFWSFVVSIILFTLGAAFAVYEGIAKIRHPHELESPGVAVAILVVAAVLEAFSLRTAFVESAPARGGDSILVFVRRSKSPELPVVLLEDIGAMVGLVLALTAVGLTVVTGDPIWDGVGTLVIGLLLGVIAVVLAVEMKSLLIGESATNEMEDTIRSAAVGAPGALSVIHLRTQHIGPEQVLVGMKMEFAPNLSISELAVAVDAVEAAVRAAVPEVQLMYVEPDLLRATS